MKHLHKLGKRRCYSCKGIYDLNENNFYKKKGETNNLSYQCKTCRKKFTNGGNIRRKLIEDANFSCIKCKIKNQDYKFFDVDHIIPKHNRKRNSRNCYVLEKEKNNLQVLCPNCHRLKTIEENWSKK